MNKFFNKYGQFLAISMLIILGYLILNTNNDNNATYINSASADSKVSIESSQYDNINNIQSESSQDGNSKIIQTFTNKFGTSTTKCNYSGCQNYIASSGDTNCCTTHSNKCLECSKYIDDGAVWCMSCTESTLNQAAVADNDETRIKFEDCDICKKPATETINGEFYCDKHYVGALEWYSEQGKKK